MTMIYQRADVAYLRRQRAEAEPDVDMVQCEDGLWRTVEAKAVFDKCSKEFRSHWLVE